MCVCICETMEAMSSYWFSVNGVYHFVLLPWWGAVGTSQAYLGPEGRGSKKEVNIGRGRKWEAKIKCTVLQGPGFGPVSIDF